MSENIDHESCSELLRDYASGELDASGRRAVDGHLTACADCRRELAALRALRAVEPRVMDARERNKLRAAVDRAIGPSASISGLPPRRSWAQRFAPSLGAAALLLVVLVVALTGGTIGGDDESGAPAEVQEPAARPEDGGGNGGDNGEQTEDQSAEEADSSPRKKNEQEDEILNAAGTASAPKPVFRKVTVHALEDMSDSRILAQFAASYTVADAEKRWDDYLQRLSELAPAGAKSQIETCGVVVESSAGDSVLPAAGAYGTIADEPSLLLSFVYSDDERGPLERYMVWAWPRGSCSDRLGYASGSLED